MRLSHRTTAPDVNHDTLKLNLNQQQFVNIKYKNAHQKGKVLIMKIKRKNIDLFDNLQFF